MDIVILHNMITEVTSDLAYCIGQKQITGAGHTQGERITQRHKYKKAEKTGDHFRVCCLHKCLLNKKKCFPQNDVYKSKYERITLGI